MYVHVPQTAQVKHTITSCGNLQKQDRYKAIQALVNHLDSKVNGSWETKQGILDTLSQCVAVVADGSLGKLTSTFTFSVVHWNPSIPGV